MKKNTEKRIPENTLERLVLYRRILDNCENDGKTNIYSHEMAALAGNTSSQIRRDLMSCGCSGATRAGYNVKDLQKDLRSQLGYSDAKQTILVGIGNLGRAILSYFNFRQPRVHMVAAFDILPDRLGRVISGTRCHDIKEMENIIQENQVTLGVITVPRSEAQATADRLVAAGITGILNFAPVTLKLPDHVYVENMDITMKIEKIAFYSGDK